MSLSPYKIVKATESCFKQGSPLISPKVPKIAFLTPIHVLHFIGTLQPYTHKSVF